MNRVTCQASADLQRPRTAPAPTPPAAGASAAAVGGGRPRWGAGATHTSAPTAADAAQQASEPRQPRANRSAGGTASPTATAAEAPIAAVYSPVIAPVRSGKSRFTRLGTSTLPAVIASPSRAVPPSSVTTGPLERSRMPPLSTTRLASSVRSVPKRRASLGTTGESTPKASSGRVVTRPASPLEIPVSPRIAPVSGPTDVIAARRFKASRRIPAASSPARGRVWSDDVRTMPTMVRVCSVGPRWLSRWTHARSDARESRYDRAAPGAGPGAARPAPGRRRAQRPRLGRTGAGGLRLRPGRRGGRPAGAANRHPTAARGRSGSAVLVGLRARQAPGRPRGQRHARADRRGPRDGGALRRRLRAGDHRRWGRAGGGGGTDRLAAGGRGRSLDRLLPGHAAHAVRPGRALPDAHPQRQRALGRLRHRRARLRRADPLRRGGRAGDEPARHARGPQPRGAGDDAGGARGERGAGDLLPLLRQGPLRRAPQRSRRGARSARRQRRGVHGDLRADV